MFDLPSLPNPPRKTRTTRLPNWLVKSLRFSEKVRELKTKLRARDLHTVCEEARCPNLGECWERGTATFMILGGVCTRHCGFCSVTAGRPEPVDAEEPSKVAEMVGILGLKHVVITCVARDDLDDCGASHFVRVIQAVRSRKPDCMVEILTTDFQMKRGAMEAVCRARPDVFNHNLETVERLTDRVRHRANYRDTLEFLRRIKRFDPDLKTKSGIMVGLGEKREEVVQALKDLRDVGCELLTIGQYLQPTTKNLPVAEFVELKVFEEYEKIAYEIGFESVASGPFVRSSYHADEMIR